MRPPTPPLVPTFAAARVAAVAPPGAWRPARAIVAAVAGRERDVRDTLWLLCTMTFVLAPHAVELPVWCSLAIGALIAWRAWLTWSGHRLPHRLIPIALTCLAGIAVWIEYRTIFGKDAGVAYVTLLLGLKLLELRAKRDIFVVIFLCLFVMLTALFESQTIGMAFLLMAGLWMLVTALVSVQFATHEPPFRKKAAIALRLVLFALPLMAVLFVLFPRVDGPLWGMPSDAYESRTGLSEVMAPGSFGRLSESREMAFRVQFAGAPPRPADRYWRGPVLGVFDGRAWTPASARPSGGPRSVTVDRTSAIDYTMTLEPANRPWLFALDTMLGGSGARQHEPGEIVPRVRADSQAVGDTPIRERARYTARSYTRYRIDADLTRARMQGWLELPPGFNPRTHALAARMLGGASGNGAGDGGAVDDAAVSHRLIDRVLTMIRTQAFTYTLDPPPLGRDSVDEFWFDTRRGYCEHFASAFVVLMRALDIPARVVTGYQGGEFNPVDGMLEVRQRDAHAWAEVWVAGEGWLRVDPTAAVAPDRIERGAAEALSGVPGFIAGDSWVAAVVRNTRFNWDAVGNTWNQWILAYNADRQSGLFRGIGIERIDWQMLTIVLIVAFTGVLAVIGAATLSRHVRRDPVTRQYERACALLARASVRAGGRRVAAARSDCARRPAEGAQAYLARIRERLPAGLTSRAEAAFALYQELRYGRPRDARDEAALRSRFARSVAALREA